jgi:hypothetical protein
VGLKEYLDGSIVCPDATAEPCAARNWTINNGAMIAFLGLKASEEEQEFIENKILAKDIWDVLTSHHEQEGPIMQILLIQQVLDCRYSHTERFSVTSVLLSDMVNRILAISKFNKNLFLSVTMLHALSSDLTNVRDHVATALSASTKDAPFTSSDI